MTLRPFGPSVTLTALARMSTPRSMRSRASPENLTSLAAMVCNPLVFRDVCCLVLAFVIAGLDPPARPKPLRRGVGPAIHHPAKKDGCPGRLAKTRFALLPGHDDQNIQRRFRPVALGHHAHDVRLLHDQGL